MQPIARSAMHHLHEKHGAKLAPSSGWQLPAAFAGAAEEVSAARAGAGLWDLSARAKWEVIGSDTHAALSALIATSPPGVGRVAKGALSGQSVLALRLADDRALVLGPPGTALEPALRGALPSGCVHLIDVTSAMCGVRLGGSAARDILAALTSLDVSAQAWPDLACAQTGLAHVHAILLRHDVAGFPSFEAYASRNYGAYLWEALLEAGRGRGLSLCGLEAERLLVAPTATDPH